MSRSGRCRWGPFRLHVLAMGECEVKLVLSGVRKLSDPGSSAVLSPANSEEAREYFHTGNQIIQLKKHRLLVLVTGKEIANIGREKRVLEMEWRENITVPSCAFLFCPQRAYPLYFLDSRDAT